MSSPPIHLDGKEHPSNAGYVGIAIWRGPRVLEEVIVLDKAE